MAIGQLIEAPGQTQEQYDQVLQEIGVSGTQLAPAPGHLVHFAGPSNGGWMVVNVWESKEQADRFFAEKMAPARKKLGLGELQVREFPVYRLAR